MHFPFDFYKIIVIVPLSQHVHAAKLLVFDVPLHSNHYYFLTFLDKHLNFIFITLICCSDLGNGFFSLLLWNSLLAYAEFRVFMDHA